jgi:hypothetical protein
MQKLWWGIVETIRTLIPMRLDRLPWSRFHRLVILSLGITWILDGLEVKVTLVGAISGILGSPRTLDLTPAEIGLLASWYILGAVLGALIFGWATDRFGRRRISRQLALRLFGGRRADAGRSRRRGRLWSQSGKAKS